MPSPAPRRRGRAWVIENIEDIAPGFRRELARELRFRRRAASIDTGPTPPLRPLHATGARRSTISSPMPARAGPCALQDADGSPTPLAAPAAARSTARPSSPPSPPCRSAAPAAGTARRGPTSPGGHGVSGIAKAFLPCLTPPPMRLSISTNTHADARAPPRPAAGRPGARAPGGARLLRPGATPSRHPAGPPTRRRAAPARPRPAGTGSRRRASPRPASRGPSAPPHAPAHRLTVAMARGRSPQKIRPEATPAHKAARPVHNPTTRCRAARPRQRLGPRHCRNATRPAPGCRRAHTHRDAMLAAGARRPPRWSGTRPAAMPMRGGSHHMRGPACRHGWPAPRPGACAGGHGGQLMPLAHRKRPSACRVRTCSWNHLFAQPVLALHVGRVLVDVGELALAGV